MLASGQEQSYQERVQKTIIDALMYSEPLCGDMPVSCSLSEIIAAMRERGFEVSAENEDLKNAVWSLIKQGRVSLQSNI